MKHCTTNEKRKDGRKKGEQHKKQFAKKRVESQPIRLGSALRLERGSGGSVSNAVTINVHAAPGQSPEAIAAAVEQRMSEKLNALSHGTFADGVY